MTLQKPIVALGLKDRKHFTHTDLKPALGAEKIEVTQLNKPNTRF
jgi:hypothetical protein